MPAVASYAESKTANRAVGLRVWSDESIGSGDRFECGPPDPTAHRIEYPGAHRISDGFTSPNSTQTAQDKTINHAVLAEAARLVAQFTPTTISRADREFMRANWSIRQLFVERIQPERLREVRGGALSAETLNKDRQAINRWEACTRPRDWDSNLNWPGVPLGMLSAPMISHFFTRMREEGYADGTISSTRCHFATIIHAAQRLDLVDHFDIPETSVERSENRIYSHDEATSAYLALRNKPSLQAAFVLDLGCGARPSDLFSLKWEHVRLNDRPIVRFTSIKAGRFQSVPLHPVVVSHLERLPTRFGYLFPDLCSPGSKNPEKTTVARRRTTLLKSLLFNAGVGDIVNGELVEIDKPFQVCRSTAGTWIERVARGMSSVLLGHASDGSGPKRVTRVHYLPSEMEPSPDLVKAVNAVEWPTAFKIV